MRNLKQPRTGKSAVPNVMPWLLALPLVLSTVLLTSCGDRTVLHTKDVDSEIVSEQKAQVRVWFVKNRNGDLELSPVVRSTSSQDRLKESVCELVRGPSQEEEAEGLASEIPRGTVLIDIKENGEEIELNLSKRFSSGGGTASFEKRMEQLSKTVAEIVGEKKVYLNVEGERLTTANGDGLEIKQPIN